MPLVCNYYLTYRCNARCTFCDLWQHENRDLADASDVLDNLKTLRAAGVRIVDFTGGEPLMHPELPMFLRVARKHGLMTTVTTNGILYPKLAAELHGLISILHISIDSMDPIVHDKLRGISCYDLAIKSVETALSSGEKPDLLFTAGRDNYKDVVPLSGYARSKNLVLIVNPMFEVNGGEGALGHDELVELERLCRKPNVYLNGGVIRIMLEGGNNTLKPRCRAVSSSIVISPDNELLLPCFHRAQGAVSINGSLNRALASAERMKWLHLQGREDICRNCTINCYLAPSLPYRLDRYFASFIPWGVKYLYYRNFRLKPAESNA
ncbi:radical SAM protein [candidate division LCP-89 bacterium B3_LCP]|uniref:Radical SAM protein n=1 Tax=candidate division LCP-89 bacterium B3_LCP TaxID=2012998 RepID=A0A532V564_UNCL8|nr:MAG: radical SAM protein [candidate division LCP-89 bacterium B3_LCP]